MRFSLWDTEPWTNPTNSKCELHNLDERHQSQVKKRAEMITVLSVMKKFIKHIICCLIWLRVIMKLQKWGSNSAVEAAEMLCRAFDSSFSPLWLFPAGFLSSILFLPLFTFLSPPCSISFLFTSLPLHVLLFLPHLLTLFGINCSCDTVSLSAAAGLPL